VIETIVDAVAATIQAIVDAVTAFVEALFDAFTSVVDSIGDNVTIVGHYRAAKCQQPCDEQPCLCSIQYSPCIHVISPQYQAILVRLFVQRTARRSVDRRVG
jgi:hypothetical protein